jgi:hypothetical protein
VLYQGNTQAMSVFGLQDAISSTYLNSATLTATLVDQNGIQISECIDVPLNYVAGSNGNYEGSFGDANFVPPVGTGYTLIIDGSQNGSTIHLELLVEIKVRNS